MNKINWFKRLFMSWDKIVEFINKNNNIEKQESLELFKNFQDEIIKGKNEIIQQLNERINEKNNDYEKLKEINIKLETKLETEKNNETKKIQEIFDLEKRLSEYKEKLDSKRIAHEELKQIMSKKLLTLDKIDNTFFGKTGNKGKGEFGELKVRTILEKSGFRKDLWVENLTVDNNTVEFAIRSGEEEKWIPVDSKVLEAKADTEGNILIDSSYKNKIFDQAKKISKYLSKKNTAAYGLMVLQSDSIYIELYKVFPDIFKKVLKDHKVYISSPSSFIQFSWSISNIIEIYERINKDENIYNEMVGTLETAMKLTKKIEIIHKDFNILINSHYPALEKKQNSLIKKLIKNDKIKEQINK